MKTSLSQTILAVITLEKDRVGGGAPIFVAADTAEMQRKALYLARIFMGAVHQIDDKTLIVVKH